jgi:ferredoxin
VKTEDNKTGRRKFLRTAGAAVAGLGAVVSGGMLGVREAGAVGAGAESASSPVPGYDWKKHRWAYGIDATKCIGCLRCVKACKEENDVARDAHHFRTWVERYVYLEGEEKPLVDSQADPQNIAASGTEADYRFDNRYPGRKPTTASTTATRTKRSPSLSSCPKCAITASIRPVSRSARWARLSRPRTAWC